jgi:hypothetical protein
MHLLISNYRIESHSLNYDKHLGKIKYLGIVSLLSILCTACFDSTFEPLPCGGINICSEPRVCINNACVFACYQDEECDTDERCERQVCVSKKLAQTNHERMMTNQSADMSFDMSDMSDMSLEDHTDAIIDDMTNP